MVLFNITACSARKSRACVLILLLLGQEAGAFLSSSTPPPSDSSNFRKPKDGTAFMAKTVSQRDEETPELSISPSQIHHNDDDDVNILLDLRSENETVPLRRLTVLGAQYSTAAVVDAVGGAFVSNIVAQSKNSNNIVVTAGVKYPKMTVTAVSGLGAVASTIRVKLVKADMGITTCANAVSEMDVPPFNGDVNVASSVVPTSNDFLNVAFPRAGVFKLCYTRDSVKWEELPTPLITVVGAKSSTLKVWCSKTIMEKSECKTDFTAKGCQCKGRIDGFHWSGSELIKTGLPTPVTAAGAKDSVWLARTNANSQNCGDGTIANGIPFSASLSAVTNSDGYEIHNFGNKPENIDLRVWKICYCPNFDFQQISADNACDKDQEKDFPQLVGSIITVSVVSRMGANDVTVYPTLKFSLVLMCGSDGVDGDGGCENNKNVRYKVVESKPENNNLYFEDSSGCRFLDQAKTEVDGSKVVGGHIGPENCKSASSCIDEPEIESSKTPTWDNVQIDASYHNRIMVQSVFDICYCDKNCENSANWFKAGEIPVMSVEVKIIDTADNPVPKPVVNTNYYFQIEGQHGPGSWSTTGAKTREMKILSDPGGLVDKDACLTSEQPAIISGHSMGSGPTDYAEPSHPVLDLKGKVIGFKYGEVRADAADPLTAKPNIKVKDAGWVAVCYCDSECNQRTNWAVFGRRLIRGPAPNQAWTRTANVPFDLEVKGWGLESTNYVMICDPENELSDCGRAGVDKSPNVFGPIGNSGMAVMKMGVPITGMERDKEGFGTIISFSDPHKLSDGDVIELFNVRIDVPGGAPEKVAMFNTAHEIFVVCDEASGQLLVPGCHKILIRVVFSSREFPSALAWDTAQWKKTSVQMYEKIRISKKSPDGRGFIVCWSQIEDGQSYFVGQLGKITVKEPVEMPLVDASVAGGSAMLSLTTLQADVTAPIIITFITGDRAQYRMSENEMQLKLVFMSELKIDTTAGTTTELRTLEPKDFAQAGISEDTGVDELGEAHQAVCGRFFLEMWTNAPRGFPQPKGCYYNKDKTDPNQELWQFYIVFNAKNHLTSGHEYQLVMNAQATDQLAPDIPNSGAVHVWSMDDTVTNINGVVERGKAFPLQKRTPAEATKATATDPHFHDTEGFKITPDEGTTSGHLTMTRFCKFDDGTEQTPNAENSCKPCSSEAACGNSNPAYTWCVSPIDQNCPQVPGGDLTQQPAFVFQLRGKGGAPITPGTIVRVFLQPFTQWRIGTKCEVKVTKCPGGSDCGDAQCDTETAVKGQQQGNTHLQINVLKVSLPAGGSAIGPAEDDRAEVAVSNLPLPPGGFFPVVITAELQKSQATAPVYWGGLSQTGGTKLYLQPRITIASIVTKNGDGDAKRFVSTLTTPETNTIYVKIISGATLFSPGIGDLSIDILVPEDYKCMMVGAGKPAPQALKLFGDLEPLVPTGNGTLGGNLISWEAEGTWSSPKTAASPKCSFTFGATMAVYAGSSLYTELIVQNPKTPRQKFDTSGINSWYLNITKSDSSKTYNAFSHTFAGEAPNFGPNLSVLGKLSSVILTPANFGIGQKNMMMIFFKTEQPVGTKTQKKTEIWVDAPSGYDFGQVCKVEHLNENYYVPVEHPQLPTRKIPSGVVILCHGALSKVGELTYNRAKVRTTGRLAKETFYGFQLQVTNGYVYNKSPDDRWQVWTYMFSDDELVAGVDGTFEPIPFYQNNPSMTRSFTTIRRMGFGAYQRNIPSHNFGVNIYDLRPNSNAGSTVITIFPIILGAPTDKNVRVVAPAGFKWNFEQVDFKYRSKLTGAPEGEYVEGAEGDVPLSLVPTRPIAEPFNELKIDYMKAAWKPNLKYGVSAKIEVPNRSPTASANIFTIEFGYDQDEIEDRLEAGATEANMVQKLINGAVDYLTNIAGQNNTIYFSLQTISKIEFTGGLVIIGPPNFSFNRKNPKSAGPCTPKPMPGYPEMPADSTCTFEPSVGDARPIITITAGHSGIPVAMYRFFLDATNPPQQVTAANRDSWVFNSYRLVSEKTPLDSATTVEGFLINTVMKAGNLVHAVKQECTFVDQLDATQLAVVQTKECAMEDWQYHPPYGLRNDRPGARNHLIFHFTLTKDGPANGKMTIRAPEGFIFDTECLPVITDEAKVFNNINTDGEPPDGFSAQPRSYARWTKDGAVVTACDGKRNIAELTISSGLKKFMNYVFRMSVASNPISTPIPNKFILEYNGESSEPFEGFQMWAFTDGEIIPQATGVSLRPPLSTENLVSIHFRPFNAIPLGGRIRIFAPSGFVIATICDVQLILHESSQESAAVIAQMNTADKTEYNQWAKFEKTDLLCKGETKPSNKAEVSLLGNKMLKAKALYIMKLLVINPQSMTSESSVWQFESFEDNTPESILDAAFFTGFPINYVNPQFLYTTPSSKNALAKVALEFTMGFPQMVVFGDRISIIAPVGYFLSTLGNDRCIGYKHILGPLTRTQPTCSANMITWKLVDERVPPYQDVVFTVQITNPESTPEDNLFTIRQLSESGVQKSSKVIPGYLIIPDLREVKITNVPPLHPCRSEINVITQRSCIATDSFSTIGVTFTPVREAAYVRVQGHVSGQYFSFLESQALADEGMETSVIANTETMFIMKSVFMSGIQANFGIDMVQNPPVAGLSYWSVTTYVPIPIEQKIPTEEDRADEKLDQEEFEVQRFNEILATTSVTPQYYKEMGATVRFEVKMGRNINIGDIVTITRPSNYTILEDPKIKSYQKGVKVGDAGLDEFRRWSRSWENPETYYFVMDSVIPEKELFSFSFKANLPAVPEMQRHWIIRSFKLLPVLDEDGKIVDDSQAPYPWLNRDLKETSTNDGAFGGFSLIGKIPFNIVPERQTPGARVVLTLTFGLEAQIIAQNPDGIKVVLSAPTGFRFEASCRQGTSTQFRQCIGINNQARLVASTKRLVGTNIQLGIAAYNPTETPEFNRWELELYKDVPIASKQFSNKSEWDGYEITPMEVVYRGNNQLAESATGFFSFTPVRELTRRGYIEVTPPKGLGYQVNCNGVKSVSLPQVPLCVSEEPDRPLRLELTNSTLLVGKTYTFGVGVVNPGGPPPADLNKWGVMLQDVDMNAIDGNMKVNALELKSIPLRVTQMGWSASEAQKMARIMIGIIVIHPISAGTFDQILIVSPEGVMYSDPSSVQMGPDKLPLLDNQPISIEGNKVKIKIKKDQNISPGAYNIQFQVKNPSNLPPDNTWMVFAMKGKTEVLTHVIAGYNYGQASDVEVAQIAQASEACRQTYYNAALTLQVLLLTALRYLD